MNTNRHKASQAINTAFDKSFYQLINSCRIEESKELIENEKELSVKTIMYEVGFVSKSSFYAAFKGLTGKTPLEYRNLVKNK
ncbi:helix-turn-helix domain-containing protein [Ascidiimonas aurantiaca]|uniref:helix-turn-helix domain-containing protein n=1 Tax=Ascidiimonas aurantiaca TaxID=1685432 RepID=UPI003BB80B41